MQYWYALHTKPHKEHQVQALLTARGIETFLPAVPTPCRGNKLARSAFFPCYMFAHVDLDETGLWALHYVPGARGVVMLGDIPARVDEQIIESLRTRLAEPDVIYAKGVALKPGDRVVITSGPLVELEAVFDRRLTPAGRVRVLLEVLHRWTPVELDARVLHKATGLPQHHLSASVTS